MIFVTVGTHSKGFKRLIEKMDEIAFEIDEEIIMQIGSTEYTPRNTKWFNFLEYEDVLSIIEKADIVICHGGAGTLLDAFKFNKRVIIVPRLKKWGEVHDNHELELAESIKDQRISIIYDINDIKSFIEHDDKNNLINANKNQFELVNFLKKYLDEDMSL